MTEVLTEQIPFGRYHYGYGTDGSLVRKLIWINDYAYPGYALALDFAHSSYWISGAQAASLAAVPGYTYTRSGVVSFVNSIGEVSNFIANTPPILSAIGYEAYGAITNVVLRSAEFNVVSWNSDGLTSTGDVINSPDGTLTADKLTATGASPAQIYQYVTLASFANITSHSVFLKYGDNRWAKAGYNGGVWVDLLNGVLGTVPAGYTATLTTLSNGWYRLSMVVAAAVIADNQFFGVKLTTGDNTEVAPGVGKYCYAWQAQSMLGSYSDGGPIIATAGATASIGAEAFALSTTVPDEDYFIWTKAILFANQAISQRLVCFDEVSAANLILIDRDATGNAFIFINSGGATVYSVSVASVNGAGNTVIGLRRRSGKYTGICRQAGVTTLTAESAVIANPIGIVNVRPGQYISASNYPQAPVASVFRKAGTFTDAEIQALVAAA